MRRNEVSPRQGIDTLFLEEEAVYALKSRNEVSPRQGIDTLFALLHRSTWKGRNEVSPRQGIDTCFDSFEYWFPWKVEMRLARDRALTPD